MAKRGNEARKRGGRGYRGLRKNEDEKVGIECNGEDNTDDGDSEGNISERTTVAILRSRPKLEGRLRKTPYVSKSPKR